ncbi:MAG: hypothetical protein ACOC2F_05515 [Bacteroidota bacterium]
MVGLISDLYRETAAFGASVEYIAEGVPRCKESIVKTLEDVKQLKNPDVYKAERTLDRINGARLFLNINRTNLFKKFICSLFTSAKISGHLFRFENLEIENSIVRFRGFPSPLNWSHEKKNRTNE